MDTTNLRTTADEKTFSAIRAHMQWRAHLQDAIARDTPIAVDEIGNDRLCELGQWIAALHPEMGQTRQWKQLNAAHHAFHQEAARVAHLVSAEMKDAAAFSIREGDYADASARILEALLSLRDLIGTRR